MSYADVKQCLDDTSQEPGRHTANLALVASAQTTEDRMVDPEDAAVVPKPILPGRAALVLEEPRKVASAL